MSVEVTQSVFGGIEAVRKSGKTNMLDKNAVARLAMDMGYYDTAVWVSEIDSGTYGRLIFEGPAVQPPRKRYRLRRKNNEARQTGLQSNTRP